MSGASSVSWNTDRLRAAMKRIVAEADRRGRDSGWIHAEFARTVKADTSLVDALSHYYSVNTLCALRAQTRRAADADERSTAASAAPTLGAPHDGEPEGFSAAKATIRAKIMESVQANGKALGDCTGADLVRLGAWYAKLAGRMKPSQLVRDRFTEAELATAFAERRTA